MRAALRFSSVLLARRVPGGRIERAVNGTPALSVLLAACLAACAGSPSREARVVLADPDADPGEIMNAIRDLARAGDTTLVPRLMGLLDSPDPGERAFAHQALISLLSSAGGTRHDFGYRAWAPRPERLERIAEIHAFWSRFEAELERAGATPDKNAAGQARPSGS
ncbi:MAG: hypothetical protein HY720_15085 [Planctomycetes bacterium]|nr:hypothetical protein [Planctomycetota bacterium]